MELVTGGLKMVTKNVRVRSSKRVINGKVYKVKGHRRSRRPLGSKVKFKAIGKFLVGHDEKGNIRGSKIVLTKKKVPKKAKLLSAKKVKTISRKRAVLRARNNRIAIKKVDTDFFLGNITRPAWEKSRSSIEKRIT